MECDKCKNDLIIPSRAYLNLETYKVGGTVLTVSECCNRPLLVKMNVSYTTTPYTGNKTKDDWGVEFIKD